MIIWISIMFSIKHFSHVMHRCLSELNIAFISWLTWVNELNAFFLWGQYQRQGWAFCKVQQTSVSESVSSTALTVKKVKNRRVQWYASLLVVLCSIIPEKDHSKNVEIKEIITRQIKNLEKVISMYLWHWRAERKDG